MTKIPKTYLLLGIIILLIIIVSLFDINSSKTANRGQYPTPSENLKEKTNKLEKEEGNVDVIVEYLPEKSDANTLVFNIILDTHNVNLDSFNFEKGINKLKMYGIDISKTAVQYTKENFRGEFKKSSVLAIPYRNDPREYS